MLTCQEAVNTSGDQRDGKGRGIWLDTACKAYFTALQGWKQHGEWLRRPT